MQRSLLYALLCSPEEPGELGEINATTLELLLLSAESLDPTLFLKLWGHCGEQRRKALIPAMATLERQFACYPKTRELKRSQTSPRIFKLLQELKNTLPAVEQVIIRIFWCISFHSGNLLYFF